MARRWRYPRSRRGDYFDVPIAPVVVPPPVWVPDLVEPHGWHPRWPSFRPRRGRLAEPPWPWPPQTLYTSGGASVSSFNLAVPDGAQGLGFLVVAWAVSATNEVLTVTADSGGGTRPWALVTPSVAASNVGFAFLYRARQPGDSSTVAVTLSGARITSAAVGWWPNVAGIGVVGVLGNRAGASSTVTTAPGIVATGAGRAVIGLFAERTAAAGTNVSLDQGGARVYVEDTSAGASSALISDFTSVGTSTGSLTATYTGAGSGNGVGVLVELLPVGSTLPVPQATRPRSRLTLPSRRGRLLPVLPVTVPAAPAQAPALIRQNARRWLPPVRREHFYEPPWPAFVVQLASGVGGASDARRLVGSFRRGRFLTVPPPAVVTVPPVPPALVQPDSVRWRTLRTRRGAIQPVPLAAPTVPAQAVQPDTARSRTLRVRRGAFLPVVPAPVVAGLGPHIPRTIRPALRRGFVPRRTQFFPPPAPAGQVAGPGLLAPKLLRQPGLRPPFGWRTRDHLFEPPWPQAAPVTPRVPGLLSPRRPLAPRVVRRVRSDPPWTSAQRVPGLLTSRRPPVRQARRGRFFDRPWVGLTIGPGPVPPQLRSTRRRYNFRARRGRFVEPVWPYIPPTLVFPGVGATYVTDDGGSTEWRSSSATRSQHGTRSATLPLAN